MKKNIPGKKGQPQPDAPKLKATAKDYKSVLIGICLLLTLIAYIPAFNAGFVNWDDDDYILNNQLIRSFSNIIEMITTPLSGNYHPLTIISLAVNYALSGIKPLSYHLLNILFHLLNVI